MPFTVPDTRGNSQDMMFSRKGCKLNRSFISGQKCWEVEPPLGPYFPAQSGVREAPGRYRLCLSKGGNGIPGRGNRVRAGEPHAI